MAVISPAVRDVINPNKDSASNTDPVRGLELQIIDQLNASAPGALVEFRDLDVTETDQLLFLQAPAKAALARAIDGRETITINSAFRTVAAQYVLKNDPDVDPAARPGNSNHESGSAIDVGSYAQWETALEAQGWDNSVENDANHFQYLQGNAELTTEGVRAFQRLWNINKPDDKIPEDGIFGAATEARLAASPADGFPTTPPGAAQPPPPPPVLAPTPAPT